MSDGEVEDLTDAPMLVYEDGELVAAFNCPSDVLIDEIANVAGWSAGRMRWGNPHGDPVADFERAWRMP